MDAATTSTNSAPRLTVQQPSATSTSSARSRILVPVPILRSLKLQTGDPVAAVADARKDVFAVGTVWPSFSLDAAAVQLPPLLLASSGIQPDDVVTLSPAAPTNRSAKLPVASSVKFSLQGASKMSAEDKELLGVFVKETLVDLECLHLGQSLTLSFQGASHTLVLASAKDAQAQQIPTLPTSPNRTNSVFLVSRQTQVSLVSAKKVESQATIDSDAATTAAAADEQRIQAAYASLGGLDRQIQEIRALVEMPLTKPEIFKQYGLRPPKGVLLFGPPGTGKTSLAKAVAASTGSSYLTINGPELSSAFHGETEAKLRDAFRQARRKSPCVVIIDEIDALAPRREGGSGDGGNADGAGEVERRVVAQLLTLLDGMDDDEPEQDGGSDDEGRLDREIEIGIPTADARRSILTAQLRAVPHSLTPEQIEDLASRTHGYVGADLSALVREAGMLAVRRAFDRQAGAMDVVNGSSGLEEKLSSMALDSAVSSRSDDGLTFDDFLSSLALVRPSAMREIFLEAPKVYWSDIAGSDAAPSAPGVAGGLSSKSVHSQVRELVEWPLKHKAVFERLGVKPPRGVLLYGPPGCSKTLIARALATESGLNFIAVKGPELYSKYVGESERAVREVFKKARNAAPSIVFFDEIDALTTTRSSDPDSSGPSDRVIASLLNEMDGIEALHNVIIVAATNRPEIIDPALLRPGRLDRLLYVGPPDLATRRQIFINQTRKMAVGPLDFDKLAEMTNGCSGAEVVSICQEAGLVAMNLDISVDLISQSHFEAAALAVKRRITPAMIRTYEAWRDNLTI
ncbi:related to AFG2 - ATPase of the CDC48/PAS1/SEC18 (AAA) family [Pseudozyma flocculosa]|uniref:Related to AFG2 - ATPase of the CDC48/PAS1/SEC18 (AAA) family n=1 Tax=Pseudozyma flocculosa TaxID=84751 RepID=A0A5C3F1E6_9BASI|nr:related to AFG2 - ATPase of the CDC48/PAS1/SEC18 (AAA) family [Pseudozyma flocculosa]